jgi:hypothetical protein
MNKPAIGIVCAVIIIAVGGGLMMMSRAGGVKDDVTRSITETASASLKADVRLGNTHVPMFGGAVAIDSITIGSPDGFNTTEAIVLRNVFVELDRGSLKSDVVKVRQVTVGEMTVIAEYSLVGASNLSAMLQNTRNYDGPATARKLSISGVVLPGAQLTVVSKMPGIKPIALEVPGRVIDSGDKAQASTGNEAVAALLSDTYSQIDATVKDANLFQQVKRDSVDTAKQVGKAIGHFFKNTAGNVKDAIDRKKNAEEQTAPKQQ